MRKNLHWIKTILLLGGLCALATFQPALARSRPSHSFQDDLPTPTPSDSAPTPADIINAVNALRLARGLNALTTHPVLMNVAADQANALAASQGMIGHERPCGMTLGQDLLARGYPLLGDLSMDGYRSENWVAASTTQDAITYWLSDDIHTNTMLSPNRTDIGAAVAMGDQVYVVLETAMSTSSGNMQYDAYAVLTGIPMTVTACYGEATQYAENSKLPQYSVPVIVSTPQPGGDVVHEVKYGQTLWSIAIQYETTIAELKRLNHLPSDVISPGQKLLIKTGVTQSAPITATASPEPAGISFAVTPPPPSATPVVAPSATKVDADQFIKDNSFVIFTLVISFSVLLAGLGVVGRKKRE